jgi:hypothetical protein
MGATTLVASSRAERASQRTAEAEARSSMRSWPTREQRIEVKPRQGAGDRLVLRRRAI